MPKMATATSAGVEAKTAARRERSLMSAVNAATSCPRACPTRSPKASSHACSLMTLMAPSASRARLTRRSRATSSTCRGNQRSSEVIRGHQRSSEVIRGHQRSSEVIRGYRRSSEVIRGPGRLEAPVGTGRWPWLLLDWRAACQAPPRDQAAAAGGPPRYRVARAPRGPAVAHTMIVSRTQSHSEKISPSAARTCSGANQSA